MRVQLKTSNTSARLKEFLCRTYRANVTSNGHNDSLQWHMVPGPDGNHDKWPNFLSKGAAVEKLKEVASWYHHGWVCGEILPHFDMHHIFVASKLRKMLKLAHSLKMGLSANQKWAGSHPTISKSYNKNVKGRKVWTPGNKNGERSQTCGRGSRVFYVRRVRVQR